MKYLAPIPKQFVDHNGLPLSDGKVHVYISGDTQYANVYQDADGEELMPNPARLDSNGAWLGFVTAGVPMDYVVEDKDGNVQFEYEKVVAGSGTANVAIEPVLTSGTKIAECWVDGELLELFAPEGGGGSSTIHHLAAGQYGYLIDMDNNGNIVTDQVLDSWMRNNEDVVLYDTYADASGYSNKPYMVQWYDAISTFTEGSTKIRFSRVGDANTPAKLTLYGFASNSEGYMKSTSISGHASPWTVDISSYTAGAGIDITSNVISANFVSSTPKSAITSSTFPAVNNGQYTITSEDLQGGFIHLRLADIRPVDAVQAGIGCTFQVFIKGMRFYRQDLQTTVTVGSRLTCEFEWVLAEIANPSLWLNADPINDVEFAWKNQEFTAYRSLAFACDDNGADWVTNAPHLVIYLPPELRSELQVDDILEIAGEIYVRPGKDRLSLV